MALCTLLLYVLIYFTPCLACSAQIPLMMASRRASGLDAEPTGGTPRPDKQPIMWKVADGSRRHTEELRRTWFGYVAHETCCSGLRISKYFFHQQGYVYCCRRTTSFLQTPVNSPKNGPSVGRTSPPSFIRTEEEKASASTHSACMYLLQEVRTHTAKVPKPPVAREPVDDN